MHINILNNAMYEIVTTFTYGYSKIHLILLHATLHTQLAFTPTQLNTRDIENGYHRLL